MNKLTGLVLTGGGAKAAYQAGALVALGEIFPQQTCPFEIIAGTSAGAINAVHMASTAHDWVAGTKKLQGHWSELTLKDIYKTGSFSIVGVALGWISRTLFGGKFLHNASANYLLDTKPLEETLKRNVDFAQVKANIAQGSLRAISFTMTQYFSTNSITFFDGAPEIQPWTRLNRFGIRTELTTKHVMASSAIPIFFPPIEIEEKFYGDGSLRQTTPLSAAIHLGAERVLSIGIRHEANRMEGIHAQGKTEPLPPSLAQISGELMNSIFLDSMDSDIERLQSINKSVELIGRGTTGQNDYSMKKIEHLHLCPSQDLQSLIPNAIKKFPWLMQFLFHGLGASRSQGNNLMGYLSFLPECSIPLMDLGYQDTIKKKDQILEFFSK